MSARCEGTVVHGTFIHVPMVLSVSRACAEFLSIVWFLCMLQQFQHLWGALCKPLATSDLLMCTSESQGLLRGHLCR